MKRTPLAFTVSAFLFLCSLAGAQSQPAAGEYHGVFQELPITQVSPQGWFAEFLTRQRDGLGLHREFSGYPFDTNLWVGKIPSSPYGPGRPAPWDTYEQTAYMIDGLYRCGLLLQDAQLKKLGEQNVGYVLAHPAANGKLGPETDPISMNLIGGGKAKEPLPPTQWPFAVFTRAMMAYYDDTGDKKMLDELTAHYLSMPENFGVAPRDVDNVEGMCWLYGKTGDKRMIEMAERTWKNFVAKGGTQWSHDRLLAARDNHKPMHGHGVSVCEATKQPAILYLYTGKSEYLEAVVAGFESLVRDHELVDGVITSDAGLSGKQPDHYHETCCVSDYSWSLSYVFRASGDAKWADTFERCVLNAGLGVIDKDFKSLQYYGAPNQMIATNSSMKPTTGVPYREHQAYRPDFSVQCCTGNVHRMLPNYGAMMWMGDGKGGVAAVLYAPSTLRTTAGADKTPVTIVEKTEYPFDGAIELKVSADKPVAFPLYLRIPGWAQGATLAVNGKPTADKLTPGTFFKLERTFTGGDVVSLNLPMPVRFEKPVENGVSLFRGPLLFALKMKVNAKVSDKRIKNTTQCDPNYPCWDLTPASDWNYALAINGPEDLAKVKVEHKAIGGFPWTPDTAPVVLTVPAWKAPSWVLAEEKTKDGTPVTINPPLPEGPVATAGEVEQIQLIPYGATQLRVSVFPVAAK